MEGHRDFPPSIKIIQRSLEPYLKSRQEVIQIRRILASHLSSHLNTIPAHHLGRPLSLVDVTVSVGGAPHGVRGLQREYLKCVRANVKARQDYNIVRREHRTENKDSESRDSLRRDDSASHIKTFVGLVRQRQKHERLRIIQDYVDVLFKKPAAGTDYLDAKVVLKDVESLPQMPQEIMSHSDPHQGPGVPDLRELVGQLEKSVLRAKMLLKREQKLLAKVRAENNQSSNIPGGRLRALAATRSGLINWIESELARADDMSLNISGQALSGPEQRGKDYFDVQIASIKRQYTRYATARHALITAATAKINSPKVTSDDSDPDLLAALEEPRGNGHAQLLYPYFDELLATSNGQKAIIQQKSHLTTSLARCVKEASQGLDRLVEESHLLPAHPLPAIALQRNTLGGTVSFGDEISSHEKPDSSRRAQAWVYAAESAGHATNDSVSEKVEEGQVDIVDAFQTLLELQCLFGNDTEDDGTGSKRLADIWATLDGNLGVIKGEEV